MAGGEGMKFLYFAREENAKHELVVKPGMCEPSSLLVRNNHFSPSLLLRQQ